MDALNFRGRVSISREAARLVKLRPLYERIARQTIHNTRRKHVAVLADRLFYKQTSCFQPNDIYARPHARSDLDQTLHTLDPAHSGLWDYWAARGSVGANHRVVERGGLLAQIPEARMMDRVNSFRGCLLKDQGFFPVSLYFRSSSKPKIPLEIRRRESIYQVTVYRSRTIFQLLQIVSCITFKLHDRVEGKWKVCRAGICVSRRFIVCVLAHTRNRESSARERASSLASGLASFCQLALATRRADTCLDDMRQCRASEHRRTSSPRRLFTVQPSRIRSDPSPSRRVDAPTGRPTGASSSSFGLDRSDR